MHESPGGHQKQARPSVLKQGTVTGTRYYHDVDLVLFCDGQDKRRKVRPGFTDARLQRTTTAGGEGGLSKSGVGGYLGTDHDTM